MVGGAERGKRVQGEFICPGCGQPLNATLCSNLCFAEGQVYCEECERDYQEGRGKWAERVPTRVVHPIPRGES